MWNAEGKGDAEREFILDSPASCNTANTHQATAWDGCMSSNPALNAALGSLTCCGTPAGC
jgi:hypothetical protein